MLLTRSSPGLRLDVWVVRRDIALGVVRSGAGAFRGELVPTEAELARAEGRDYETADALLQRIRAEQAGAAPKPRKARGRAGATS